MHTTLDRIGLIAGTGEVPVYFARKASQLGIKLISIGFSKEIQNDLAPFSKECYSIGVGQPGKIFKTLQQNNVKELLILGKVDKRIFFKIFTFINFWNS